MASQGNASQSPGEGGRVSSLSSLKYPRVAPSNHPGSFLCPVAAKWTPVTSSLHDSPTFAGGTGSLGGGLDAGRAGDQGGEYNLWSMGSRLASSMEHCRAGRRGLGRREALGRGRTTRGRGRTPGYTPCLDVMEDMKCGTRADSLLVRVMLNRSPSSRAFETSAKLPPTSVISLKMVQVRVVTSWLLFSCWDAR